MLFSKSRKQTNISSEDLFAQGKKLHEARKYAEALELFHRAAESGHVAAYNAAGVCCMCGDANLRLRGISYFRKGAEAGNVRAMVNLGTALSKGDGTANDECESFLWMKRAADAGDGDASLAVAKALFHGRGTEKNLTEAKALFEKLSQQGNNDSTVYLGFYALHGLAGSAKDEQEAVAFFQQAAQQKHPEAMFHLATAYERGTGVEVDLGKSLALHKDAWEEGGHLPSLFKLGLNYMSGTGVLVDADKAVECFEVAAKRGHVEAMNQLGSCYLHGHGTKRNVGTALRWFRESAEQTNNATGLCQLGSMYLNGIAVEQDPKRACTLFQRAIDQGSTEALYQLACCRAAGLGITCDKAIARSLLCRASERKHGLALRDLAHQMQGDNRLAEAVSLYKRSLEAGCKSAKEQCEDLVRNNLPPLLASDARPLVDKYVSWLAFDNDVPWSIVKVAVLGMEGIGKTTLFHRLCRSKYEKNVSTEGVDLHSNVLVNGMTLTWLDFGGQTVFCPTHEFFLTRRSVYLVCFKFGSVESIERAKYWLQYLRCLAHHPKRPIKVVVVGTHSDALRADDEERSVFDSLASAMDGMGEVVGHIAVSCVNGTGLDGVIRGLELAAQTAGISSRSVPSYFLVVEAWLKKLSHHDFPVVSREDVTVSFPCLPEHSMEAALDFFADAGVCVYHRAAGLVCEPVWLAKTFSSLITYSHNWVSNGVASLHHLRQIWPNLSSSSLRQVMRLFESFELSFQRRRKDEWVIPAMMRSPAQFDLPKVSNAAVQRSRWVLELLPHGLLARITARIHAWVGFQEDSHLHLLQQDSLVVLLPGLVAFVGSETDSCGVFVRIHEIVGHEASLSEVNSPAEQRERSGALVRRIRLHDSHSTSHRPRGHVAAPRVVSVPPAATKPLPELPSQKRSQSLCESLCPSLRPASIVDILGGHIEDSLRAAGLPVQRLVSCPHCLLAGNKQIAETSLVDFVSASGDALLSRPCHEALEKLIKQSLFPGVELLNVEDLLLEKVPFAAGGFGSIFKGFRRSNRFQIVAKRIGDSETEAALPQVRSEAFAMAHLIHPNLVCLFGVTFNPLQMILEFCGGGDLLQAIRGGKVRDRVLRMAVARDIALGLHFMHSRRPPIAHRDLRSPNVFLVATDHKMPVVAKIGDFGLSVAVYEQIRDALSTWQWMAPEAQVGEAYTERCDLYSLGIVFFEIWEGQGLVPFCEYDHMRMPDLFAGLRAGTLRPTLPTDTEPWIVNLIQRLWSSFPESRPSARDVAALFSRECDF